MFKFINKFLKKKDDFHFIKFIPVCPTKIRGYLNIKDPIILEALKNCIGIFPLNGNCIIHKNEVFNVSSINENALVTFNCSNIKVRLCEQAYKVEVFVDEYCGPLYIFKNSELISEHISTQFFVGLNSLPVSYVNSIMKKKEFKLKMPATLNFPEHYRGLKVFLDINLQIIIID